MPKSDKSKSQREIKEISRLKKLTRILEKYPTGLWLRELSRQAKLHPEKTRRIISKYPLIFDEYADFTQYNIKLKLIKLKPNYKQKYKKIFLNK